jgi:hypothetical protein
MTTPGIDLELNARLCASLDGVAASLGREDAWRQKIARAITQVPFAGTITLSGGAGTDDQPDKLQAKTGFIWSVRRLTANGYSAGTVTAYRNSTTGEPVMPFPVAAVNTIGRGELLLMPGDRLVWGATGITGTVQYWGVADCFESWFLPFYIG